MLSFRVHHISHWTKNDLESDILVKYSRVVSSLITGFLLDRLADAVAHPGGYWSWYAWGVYAKTRAHSQIFEGHLVVQHQVSKTTETFDFRFSVHRLLEKCQRSRIYWPRLLYDIIHWVKHEYGIYCLWCPCKIYISVTTFEFWKGRISLACLSTSSSRWFRELGWRWWHSLSAGHDRKARRLTYEHV